jgi:glucans biosynthesis protein
VPDQPPKPKEPFAYGYRVLWQKDREMRPPSGWVRETRRGRGYVKTADNSLEFHVDFEGPALTRLPASAVVDASLWIDQNGEILERHTKRNDLTGGWRLVVRFRRIDAAKPVELRANLTNADGVLSETWSYVLPPD